MNVIPLRRTRGVRIAAVSMLAVAALSLTACSGDGDSGSQTSGKADSTAPAASGSEIKGQAGKSDKDPHSIDTGPTKTLDDCDINKTDFDVQKVQRPVNHMLLKATNTSAVECKLVGFPTLKLGKNAQAATAVIEDSRPQSVKLLSPGESAYAGITTSATDGSGDGGRNVDYLEVSIDGNEAGKSVDLPGGSVYTDNGARVTYWLDTPSLALNW
ncbi:DUF4232 domain-containing protein [Streptomyces sp. OE57]|uniref:DUF4232 domain-containing protein n=1 Tax=Streptomyces lacaronensis TaxID=3379885 RepID=UPI0039B74A6C